jgi:hypothetical protein
MRLALNAVILTIALPAGQLVAACFNDQRPPKTSAEAIISVALDQSQIKLGEPAKLHAM